MMSSCTKRCVVIIALLGLVGCGAAPITAIFERTVRTDTIRPTWFHDPDSYVLSVTGERRVVLASADGKTVCVEPLPDVARAVDTASKVDVTVNAPAAPDPKLVSKLDEVFKTSLTKTFDRRASGDILGRLAALACFAYLNGKAVNQDQAYKNYREDMSKIIVGGIDAMIREAARQQ